MREMIKISAVGFLETFYLQHIITYNATYNIQHKSVFE